MRYFKSLVIMTLLSVSFLGMGQQSGSSEIDPEAFNAELFISLLKDKIHEARAKNNADTFVYHEVIIKAAQQNADWMATNKKEGIEQAENSKMLTTALRIVSFGGTANENLSENVITAKFARGKKMYTYDKVVDDIFKNWNKKKDIIASFKKADFVYSGIGVSFAKDQKKIYISHIMTSDESINTGVLHRKSMAQKYSKSKKGLKPYDELSCEDAKTFKYYNQLQSGLTVKSGKIYLEYGDLNQIMELFLEPKDGIAIDVIQREQYPCDKDNIYDKTILPKGIILKPTYSKKLFGKNTGGKDNKLSVQVGKLPKKISGEYELNLLVIKNKSICKTVKRSFLEVKEAGEQDIDIAIDTIEIRIDTIVTPSQSRYQVGFENKTLNFIIPFEYGKSAYRKEDMAPFIEALDEPHFIIHKITFYAHSSLEGSEDFNKKLRLQRANSIANALENFQGQNIESTIVDDPSWTMFQKQVQGTEYEYLANMTMDEVKQVLATDKKIRRALEPKLAEERFGRIVMFVTVDDIQGMQEEKYLKKKINKAIEEDDYEKALKAQRFIIENVLQGKYEYQTILDQELPWEPEYASLIVNKIWAKNHFEHGDSFNQELANYFDSLYTLAPENPYAAYNKLLCDVKNQKWKTKNDMDSIQIAIDKLYSAKDMVGVPKWNDWVNQLNIEFQFSILNWYEKGSGLNKIQLNKSINKIKKTYSPDPKISNWKLALRVAVLYGKHKYYTHALQALKPFVDNVDMESGEVNEELLFTYVIISAQMNDGNYNKSFRDALGNARLVNKERYCKLFGEPYLTFQLLDDPIIKNTYCSTCNGDGGEEKKPAAAEEKPADDAGPEIIEK